MSFLSYPFTRRPETGFLAASGRSRPEGGRLVCRGLSRADSRPPAALRAWPRARRAAALQFGEASRCVYAPSRARGQRRPSRRAIRPSCFPRRRRAAGFSEAKAALRRGPTRGVRAAAARLSSTRRAACCSAVRSVRRRSRRTCRGARGCGAQAVHPCHTRQADQLGEGERGRANLLENRRFASLQHGDGVLKLYAEPAQHVRRSPAFPHSTRHLPSTDRAACCRADVSRWP